MFLLSLCQWLWSLLFPNHLCDHASIVLLFLFAGTSPLCSMIHHGPSRNYNTNFNHPERPSHHVLLISCRCLPSWFLPSVLHGNVRWHWHCCICPIILCKWISTTRTVPYWLHPGFMNDWGSSTTGFCTSQVVHVNSLERATHISWL